MFKVESLFSKPSIVGLVGNANEAKSNLIYYILDTLKKDFKFKVYVYGLRCNVLNTTIVHSVEEIEQVQNSIIIVDEMENLFDFSDRKVKKQIEKTIRLIFHNNNILFLCGLGENFKKFLSAKLSVVIYKKTTIADLINGSVVKRIVLKYEGAEKGSNILHLNLDEALVFDGLHYEKIKIPYLKQYDTKASNVPILVRKSVPKNVQIKKVNNNNPVNQLAILNT